MSMLHSIIENHGKQAAIAAIGDRCVVEAAASYMGDADTGVGFLYSGLCQAALPHRALTDNAQHWEIKSDYVSLLRWTPLAGQESGQTKRESRRVSNASPDPRGLVQLSIDPILR